MNGIALVNERVRHNGLKINGFRHLLAFPLLYLLTESFYRFQ